MSDINLRSITNSFQDVRLASMASWRQAAEFTPRDKGGPYVVMQEGYDPQDPKFIPDEFVLGRSGKWLSLSYFYQMPVSERRAEFVFGTAAEVMQMMGNLAPKVEILRPGESAAAAPATPEEDEMAAASQAGKGQGPTATTTHGTPNAGKALLDTVQRTTGRLKAQLMGLVQAARRDRDLAQRRGRRIDGRRVTRILAGDIRIFRKRADRVAANTAVHILTDLSGSMSGHREQVAREASLAIALGLETIPGVVPAVTYFGGYASDPVRETMGHGQSVRRNAHRFMQGTWGCTPMAEAVWFGAFQLSKRGEDRKILIVVTDGAPDDAKACHTVLALCRKAGIEAVGIGIGHDAVKAFFDRYIVISSVDELRSGLFQLMRERLIVEVA